MRSARGLVMVAVSLLILSPFIKAGASAENGAEPKPTATNVVTTPINIITPTPEPTEIHYSENLGEFTLTAYCPCYECCGKFEEDPWYGITASGTEATEGRTVAVDPDEIPIGSILYINGHRYVAEDVGGAINGNHVDIFFNDHQEALEFGVQHAQVFIWR